MLEIKILLHLNFFINGVFNSNLKVVRLFRDCLGQNEINISTSGLGNVSLSMGYLLGYCHSRQKGMK